ncbi:hypothetical protein BJY59DRAFT_61117 [Rhodotorula toruloides]
MSTHDDSLFRPCEHSWQPIKHSDVLLNPLQTHERAQVAVKAGRPSQSSHTRLFPSVSSLAPTKHRPVALKQLLTLFVFDSTRLTRQSWLATALRRVLARPRRPSPPPPQETTPASPPGANSTPAKPRRSRPRPEHEGQDGAEEGVDAVQEVEGGEGEGE